MENGKGKEKWKTENGNEKGTGRRNTKSEKGSWFDSLDNSCLSQKKRQTLHTRDVRPFCLQGGPETPQGGPKIDFWMIFDSFWIDFWWICMDLFIDFGSMFHSPLFVFCDFRSIFHSPPFVFRKGLREKGRGPLPRRLTALLDLDFWCLDVWILEILSAHV